MPIDGSRFKTWTWLWTTLSLNLSHGDIPMKDPSRLFHAGSHRLLTERPIVIRTSDHSRLSVHGSCSNDYQGFAHEDVSRRHLSSNTDYRRPSQPRHMARCVQQLSSVPGLRMKNRFVNRHILDRVQALSSHQADCCHYSVNEPNTS